MKTSLVLALIAVLSVVECASSHAANLDISIRLHASEIAFADPIYIEVTAIVTDGDNVVTTPTYHSDRLRFEVMDQDSRQIMRILDANGERSPLSFESKMPRKWYNWLFLPSVEALQHSFWSEKRSISRRLSICAVYRLTDRFSGPGIEFRSNWQEVRVKPREVTELRTLQHWAKAEVEVSGKGPSPADFGITFLRPLDLDQTSQVAANVRSGELSDLLKLTVNIQTIFQSPQAERGPNNRSLTDWLRNQPDIKRQALVRKVRNLASSYRMDSTARSILELLDKP